MLNHQIFIDLHQNSKFAAGDATAQASSAGLSAVALAKELLEEQYAKEKKRTYDFF